MVRDRQARIKVETSPVTRGTVYPAQSMVTSEQVTKRFGFVEAKVLAFEDLYGSKLHAALGRRHPRDLFTGATSSTLFLNGLPGILISKKKPQPDRAGTDLTHPRSPKTERVPLRFALPLPNRRTPRTAQPQRLRRRCTGVRQSTVSVSGEPTDGLSGPVSGIRYDDLSRYALLSPSAQHFTNSVRLRQLLWYAASR